MPDAAQFATFIAVSALLGITPGPDIIYVIARGAAQGARAGVVAAAGLCTGIIAHTALCAAGLSAILAGSEAAFTVFKIAGAAYLVWLGIGMWRARGAMNETGCSRAQPLGAIYRQTVVMNLLNPKVALFFIAVLPQFVSPGGAPVALQLIVLGAIFMGVSFVVMACAGIAGGQLRRLLQGRRYAGRWMERAAGSVLIVLGIRLAFESG